MPEGQALAKKRLIAEADVLIEKLQARHARTLGPQPGGTPRHQPRSHHRPHVGDTGRTGRIPTAPDSAASAKRWAAGAISSANLTGPLPAMGISIGDTLCATYGCMGGARRAARTREKTGEGQVVDSALYRSGVRR